MQSRTIDDIRVENIHLLVGRHEKHAAMAMRLIKKAAREPDSIEFEEAGVDDAGKVACVTYRGKNGFGGYTKEFAVWYGGKLSSEPEVWNKRCTKARMHNVTGSAKAFM